MRKLYETLLMKWPRKAAPLGLMALRLACGLGIMTHGYAKLWTPGMMEKFTSGVAKLGFPQPGAFAWAAALAEFAGGLLLAAGLVTPVASLSIVITMAVAAFMAHGPNPFANLKDSELALAYLMMSFAIFVNGPGAFALDNAIFGGGKPGGASGGGEKARK